jgi:hypothetical protein
MQLTGILFLVMLLILLICLTVIYRLIQTKRTEEKEASYRVNNTEFRQKYKLKRTSDQYILDPHEAKLLRAILNTPNNTGLDVKQINELLHLSKLSKENQRQRRHIVFKELNLKLYLISGVRETITRVPSESDRRIKYYSFIDEVPEFDTIKKLALIHS